MFRRITLILGLETPERLLDHLEAIDIENSEYFSGIPLEQEYVYRLPMAR